MAVIQYSGLVTQIKGKMRGAIFQSGNAGQIIRSAKNWNKSSSKSWLVARNVLGYVSGQWAALTSTQKQAFAAQAINYPGKTKMGDVRTPSGYEVFVKQNVIAVSSGASINTTPGVPVGLSNLGEVSVFGFTPTTGEVNIQFGGASSEIQAVYMTPTLRQGRKPPAGAWKLIAILPGTTSGIVNIFSQYSGVFGAPIVGGQVWLKLVLKNQTTGQVSQPYLTTDVVI